MAWVGAPERAGGAHGRRLYVRAPRPIEFPSEEPPEEHVSETKRHLEARTTLYLLLKAALAGTAIGSNQLVYWDAGDPRKCLSPDGAKDKIQALLVLAERAGDERFAADVARLLGAAPPERIEDVRGAAQDAAIALARDPLFSDAGAEGYASTKRQVEAGLLRLEAILEKLHA